MPKIVSVKEDVGHYEEPWLVMDIQPGEIAGQDEGARVLVDFVIDDEDDAVHIHDAVDGDGKHILRDLPPKLLKRWERDLADAGEDEKTESGSDEKSDSESGREETVSDSKSDAEKDYEGFNFAKAETPDPFLGCLGSFAQLDSMAKDKAAQPGETRQRGGNRFQKQPDGSWKKVGGGAAQHASSEAPESEDYSEEDPRRQERARHREGMARAEAQHLDAAEEDRHEQHDPHEKVMIDPVEMIKAKAQPGETRDWGGQKYTKQPDGSWKKLSEGGDGGGGGGQKPPAAPKPPKVPKDRHAQILVARYMESRDLGDVGGVKAIMRRLKQVIPNPKARERHLMQFGDPDHPRYGKEALAAAKKFSEGVPTDEMYDVMRRVP